MTMISQRLDGELQLQFNNIVKRQANSMLGYSKDRINPMIKYPCSKNATKLQWQLLKNVKHFTWHEIHEDSGEIGLHEDSGYVDKQGHGNSLQRQKSMQVSHKSIKTATVQ